MSTTAQKRPGPVVGPVAGALYAIFAVLVIAMFVFGRVEAVQLFGLWLASLICVFASMDGVQTRRNRKLPLGISNTILAVWIVICIGVGGSVIWVDVMR